MFEDRTRRLQGTIERKSDIKCYLEQHAWNKMIGWCKAATSEVSGMGLCKIVRGNFVVYDVFFPLQYGSSGYTELDDRALAKLQIGLYNKKIPAYHFRFWWHTHYNFNVFWSGTDDNNATTLARANGEWELSLVINQASEYRCRVDFFKKIHRLIDEPVHVLVDNIDVEIIANSKRHRRKPHYKADIRKWVKPMSELPDKQKPKIDMCPQPINHPSDGFGLPFKGHEDGDHQYWNRWADEDDGVIDIPCIGCGNRFCKNFSICKEKPKEKTKAYKDLENGDEYGGFMWYNGFLISPDAYAKIGLSEGEGVEVKEDPGDKPHEFCECGDDTCINFEMCVHCDLCGGRCQAVNGYCPGCYDMYVKNDNPGVKDAESKSTTHH